MTQLILARGIQGLGAGALIPLAIATIGDLVPPSDRGRWQGLTGAVFGLASILGPTTGGWIADNADWRWVFLVSLPVGADRARRGGGDAEDPAAPRARHEGRLPGRGAARRRAHRAAAGHRPGRPGGAVAVGADPRDVRDRCRADGGLPVVGAARRAAGRPDRAVPPPRVSAANLAGFTVGVGMFGTIMFVPLFVQGVMGGSATSSGLVLTPLMLAMMLTSVGSGQIITRTGPLPLGAARRPDRDGPRATSG